MRKPPAVAWGSWTAALVLSLGGCASTISGAGDGGAGGSGPTGATGATGTTGTTGTTGGAPCAVVDDHNPCTDDLCVNGVPVSKPAAAGTPCATGGTVCDGLGTCVACLAPADCPGTDDACQSRTCAQGKCGLDFSPAGTALPVQTAGDCKATVCDGHGAAIQQNDDTDIPIDNAVCTTDVCTGGVPSNPVLPMGTICGPALLCDGAGLCVGCTAPSDCPGSDDACKTRTCVSGVCGVALTAAMTPLPSQTAGDCLQAVCDGSGNVASIADDADLPADDGNACTSEACHAGVPSHPAAANGTACNDGDACTQNDACQAGACAGTPVVCSAGDPCHVAGVCDPASGTCSNPAAANDGAACDDGNACTKGDQCAGGVCHGTAYSCSATGCDASSSCDGNGGCTVVNDVAGTSCPDDGNPCTSDTCDSAGTCTHPAVASGKSCGAGLVCNGTVCSAGCFIGGTLYAAGAVDPSDACQVCAPGTSTSGWSIGAKACAPTSCQASSTCDGNGGCTFTNKPDGVACPDPLFGLGGGAPGICANGVCSYGCWVNGNFYGPSMSFLDVHICMNCDPTVSTSSLYTGGCHDGMMFGVCSGTGVCNISTGGSCASGCVDCFVEPCEVSGLCYGLPNPGGTCSDGNPCTTDTCAAGSCLSLPVPNGTSCGSGLTCTNGVCG